MTTNKGIEKNKRITPQETYIDYWFIIKQLRKKYLGEEK